MKLCIHYLKYSKQYYYKKLKFLLLSFKIIYFFIINKINKL